MAAPQPPPEVHASSAVLNTPVSTRFFPTYGTEEFVQQCGYTSQYRNNELNCTFLVRPPPDSGEGISHWIPQIVAAHLYAQQTGCALYFDYGPDINIQQVLQPFPVLESSQFQPTNWTLPEGFDSICNETVSPSCFLPRPTFGGLKSLEYFEDSLNMTLAPVPDYRFAYKYSRDFFEK